MSNFNKGTEQHNVLDGTVFCVEPIPGKGAYVTVSGRDGQVHIIAFDTDDLNHLCNALTVVKDPKNRKKSSEELTFITASGLPIIMAMVREGDLS